MAQHLTRFGNSWKDRKFDTSRCMQTYQVSTQTVNILRKLPADLVLNLMNMSRWSIQIFKQVYKWQKLWIITTSKTLTKQSSPFFVSQLMGWSKMVDKSSLLTSSIRRKDFTDHMELSRTCVTALKSFQMHTSLEYLPAAGKFSLLLSTQEESLCSNWNNFKSRRQWMTYAAKEDSTSWFRITWLLL